MLCPECECPAPGGTNCPRCGELVPERETFDGQGTHYLVVLCLTSLVLFAATLLISSRNQSPWAWLAALSHSGWLWAYIAAVLSPAALGVYFWFILHADEVIITDEGIWRHSHFGDESMLWRDVRAFCRRPILLRQTRLGPVTGLSRVLVQHKLYQKMPAARYELIGAPVEGGAAPKFYLEPGTINDMDWALKLVEERVGPAVVL